MISPPADPITWTSLLGPLTLAAGEFLLYLDPDGLDQFDPIAAPLAVASDRWALRRVAEQQLRDFPSHRPPLLVHVKIPDLREAGDLPFDLRHFPLRIPDVRLPEAARGDVEHLPPRAVEQLVTKAPLPQRLAAMARALSGLAWPPTNDMALITSVRLVQHLGPELRALLAPSCPDGLGRRVLCASHPLEEIGAIVEEWAAAGTEHDADGALRAAADEISALVRAGQVRSPRSDTAGLPAVLAGAVETIRAVPDLLEQLEALPEPDETLASWCGVAEGWAALRWQLASMPPRPDATAEAKIWERWAELDVRWQAWLRANYSAELSRSVLRLTSVHKVAPFLATSVVEAGSKVLLLVLDGLGLAQWQQVLRHLRVEPLEDRRVLACLPSMTTVSRQAIFAGALPTSFPATVDQTGHEPKRWLDFWRTQGLENGQIYYGRTDGADAADWEHPPESAVVAGIAVNAVDNLMHGVSVNGDHQFHAAVTTWLAGGFLERALEWAKRRSTQVWITADHGNLPCLGVGVPVQDEGVRVLGRGLRARVYATDDQRTQTPLPGLAWTPSSFPVSAGAPLFAPDRTYFRRSGIVITHGGLSLDEVLVPFSRIA